MDSLRTRLSALRTYSRHLEPGHCDAMRADLDAILDSLPADGEVTRAAEEALRLETSATPGPWIAALSPESDSPYPIEIGRADDDVRCVALCGLGDEADAAFIAYARTALPLLAHAILAGQGGMTEEERKAVDYWRFCSTNTGRIGNACRELVAIIDRLTGAK